MMQLAIKKQHGAVLAFCLVMLLLLTLAGTRMIQQNKQQLEMANASRLLTQEFANAESGLSAGESAVENDSAHVDPTSTPSEQLGIFDDNHQCTPIADVYKQQILLAGTILVNKTLENQTVLQAQILEASCNDKEGNLVGKCSSVNEITGKVTCFPVDNGTIGIDCTGKTMTQIAELFSNSSDVCYQSYNPLAIDGFDLSPKPPKCPIETYTIKATAMNPNGTRRILIRDKQIKCGTP